MRELRNLSDTVKALNIGVYIEDKSAILGLDKESALNIFYEFSQVSTVKNNKNTHT